MELHTLLEFPLVSAMCQIRVSKAMRKCGDVRNGVRVDQSAGGCAHLCTPHKLVGLAALAWDTSELSL